MEGLLEHMKALYPAPNDDPADAARMAYCITAILLMRQGKKFEELRAPGGRISTACEVVAHYELEGFVTGQPVAA